MAYNSTLGSPTGRVNTLLDDHPIVRSKQMNEQKIAPQDQDRQPAASDQKKKPYLRPVLTAHGSVSELTMGSATVGTDAGATKNKNQQSDRNTKENIVRVGEHPLGIGLYLFDYKSEYRDQSGHGRQFGVMADEVEAVMPKAVSVHANGYKVVNYAMLGIVRPVH
jgi:hypothetical protein